MANWQMIHSNPGPFRGEIGIVDADIVPVIKPEREVIEVRRADGRQGEETYSQSPS